MDARFASARWLRNGFKDAGDGVDGWSSGSNTLK